MAALELATETQTEKLLESLPFDKDNSIISPVVLRFVSGHGFFQLIMSLVTLFYAQNWSDTKDTDSNDDETTEQNREVLTVVFHLFCKLFFTVTLAISVIAQFLIVTLDDFSCTALIVYDSTYYS